MNALETIRERFPELEAPRKAGNGLSWHVPLDRYLEACEFLGSLEGGGFELFSSLTAVDWGERLELVLLVVHPEGGPRGLLTTELDGAKPEAPSVAQVWPGAEWAERETAEMFGVVFQGRPRPGKLLLDDDFEGHPLRRDFANFSAGGSDGLGA
jgi:NADH-quinone oxidoreductase subunit C